MEHLPSLRHAEKLGAIHFPRGTTGISTRSRPTGKAMNSFAALAVLHLSERLEVSRDDAGLFDRLTSRCRFEIFICIGQTFGDAPRLAAVVVARGMDEQDLQTARAIAKEECSGRLFQGVSRESSAGFT